jgi:hypothetical protein
VQALRYGVTLFHFYQQDYFSALTELMVAQQTNELGTHTENAELLRGGMSLSYGMDIQAEQVFTELLTQSRPGADNATAWFYLGKINWQRGMLERAATSLDRVELLPNAELDQELNYLQTSINLRQGDYSAAQAYLARLPENSVWLSYHYYNMGASRAAAGDWLDAARYFRKFDGLAAASEEAKSLRDRAYTASGFAYMAAGEYTEASRDFSRVRLENPLSDRALLGYGWAVSAQLDFQEALSPWQALSEKSPVSRSVRESLLAVPYAYEQLERQSMALVRYQHAARVYEDQLRAVNEAIATFSDADLQDLLELRADKREGWLFEGDILPVNAPAPYLEPLVSSNEFQSTMKELRDLHHIDQRLMEASERLQVLAIVDEEQQLSWDAIIEQDRNKVLHQRKIDVQERLLTLQEKLEAIANTGDARALADTAQLALWDRLERAAVLSEALDKSAQHQPRLDLYRGLLLWEDNEQYAAQLWKNQRKLRELQDQVRKADDGLERLQQTQARRVQSSFAKEITGLQARLQTQSRQVQLAIAATGGELRRLAVLDLEGQAQALSRSLGRSRLAIARLYDQGSSGAAEGDPCCSSCCCR